MSIRSCGAVSGGIRNPWSEGCPSGGGSHDQRCTHRSLPRPVPVVGARRGSLPSLVSASVAPKPVQLRAPHQANEVIVTIRSDRRVVGAARG